MTLPRRLEPEVMDDPAEAAAYDAMDHRDVNRAFVDRLVELGAGGRMLDLGTGPGDIPLLLCDRLTGCAVVAVDLAESMLAIARRKLAVSPHAGRVVFVKESVANLPEPAASFDTVFSNTVLHHLADPVSLLREARRLLKPGGVLLIRDLYRPATREHLDALVARHASGSDERQKRLFADSLHAALTPEELAQAARQAGWPDLRVSVDSDRHVSLWQSRGR